MATREEEAAQWRAISRNNRKAPQHRRTCGVGIPFSQARGGPSHAGLPAYILNNLNVLPQTTRFDLNKAIRCLYGLRINADYMADAAIDRGMVLSALHDLGRVHLGLGLEKKD